MNKHIQSPFPGESDAPWQPTWLSDLLDEPEEECTWVVDGLLSVGGVSIVAGKPKAGKSTLARSIALAVARGQPILNRATTQGTVVLLSLEEHRRDVRSHFRAMEASDEPVLVSVGQAQGRMEKRLEFASDIIYRNSASLIVIDTMLRFAEVRDASNYAEMTTALNPLLSLARESNCHILLVHHCGKKDREDLDAILGSVAISGSVDTGIIVRRKRSQRTIQSIQRVGTDMAETTICLDPATRQVVTGHSLSGNAQSTRESRILAFLEDRKPRREDEIREALGGDRGKVGEALRSLVTSRKVVRDGRPGRGGGYSYRVSPFPLPVAPLRGQRPTINGDR